MNKELIDKCIDFAEGNKGKFTIYMVKKPGFPDVLIEGTEKQQVINEYAEQGMSAQKIADILGVSKATVVEHMGQYKKSVAFYDEWCQFWEFTESFRQTPIIAVCEGVLTEAELGEYKAKDINTVGDFLHCAVTMPTARLCKLCAAGQGGLDANRKTAIFNRIRELCYAALAM